MFVGATKGTYLSSLPRELVLLLDDYLCSTTRFEASYNRATTRLRVHVGAYTSPWVEGTPKQWRAFLSGHRIMRNDGLSLVFFGTTRVHIGHPDFSLNVTDSKLLQKLTALLERPQPTRFLVCLVCVSWIVVVGLIYKYAQA